MNKIKSFIFNIIIKTLGRKYYIVPKAITIIADKRAQLIIDKNKYILRLRRDKTFIQKPRDAFSKSDWDNFWQNKSNINQYLEVNRIDFYKEVIDKIQPYLKGKIIDVGCGTGDFLRLLKNKYPSCLEIFGSDISDASIERCKNIIPDGKFIQSDIFHLNFKDKYFDVVICMELLEHIEFPHDALKELTRICKTNGYAILTVPNGEIDTFEGHLNFWNLESFKVFLSSYKIVEINYIDNKNVIIAIVKNI
ncbi:class I SAM-dependent methyltransferase [candidate division WOR-3 bacterium]|nr:class I SAM-dependent methyltransferase [candidate division WOR-3 bacterium]